MVVEPVFAREVGPRCRFWHLVSDNGTEKEKIMRKIIVAEFISLDGVIQAPGGANEDTDGGSGKRLNLKISKSGEGEMKLKSKIAIVTGGGRGIGRAIAEAYAREGAKVVVTAARQKAEIEEVASRVNGVALVADVSKSDDVRLLVDSVLSRFGKIDILVNNAARGMRFVSESFMTEPKPFWEAEVDAWRMVIDMASDDARETNGQRIIAIDFGRAPPEASQSQSTPPHA
jgi:hypothetical protein